MTRTDKFAFNAINVEAQMKYRRINSNCVWYDLEDFKEVRSEDVIQIIRSVKCLWDYEIRVVNHGEYGLSIIIDGLWWQDRGVKTLMKRIGSLNNRWERWDRKHGQSHLRCCTGREVGSVCIDLAWM
jgi:hypothetical protein